MHYRGFTHLLAGGLLLPGDMSETVSNQGFTISFKQANKRFLSQRQNEVHRVPQRSTAAAAVRTGRNDYFTAWIARR